MNYFIKTQTLLNDLDSALKSNQLDEDSPLVNNYLIKIAVIIFSSEMETHLKELISRKLINFKSFCTLCNKLRNPKFKEINEILRELSIQKLNFSDEKINKYSNIMIARDKIAHNPDYTCNFTIHEFSEALEIAIEIITEIDKLTSPS